VTHDRAVAEGSIKTPVIASHAAQKCASVAHRGGYRESRIAQMTYEKMLGR
jgi:hypothetical protein